MSAPQLAMMAANETPLLLEKVAVRGSLHATLARITLEQRYRNDTDRNVEAIYTFPLPPSAVLLRTVVTLGGKKYEGTVLARAQAERKYEEGVAAGDTAIMVERPEPGIYTMNLGNLMAGESASVEIEFAQLLDWSHGRLRLALPMTIAPRYREERSALQPQQRPHIDPLVERAFDLELRVAIEGKVHSPTHPIATRAEGGELVVSLARESAWMDRDFVMVVEGTRVREPFAMVAASGESRVGFVSFQVPEMQDAARGRDVRIVIDCSGSMNGDSIALARAGAINVLNRLRAQDRFALVAFGSTHRMFGRALGSATERQVDAAIAWVQALNADMGGTELAGALEAAMTAEGTTGAADIFLVTDGQVGESQATVTRATKLGHRIFVVGIGVSPSRGMLEGMVEATGGAIDYIAPGEDVADAIGRQFARVTQEPVAELSVDWGPGVEGDWHSGLRASPYSGDTIHAFAAVRSSPRSLRVCYLAGGKRAAFEVPVAVTPAALAGDVIHRVAAAQRIREGLAAGNLEPSAAEALALQHRLVTKLTNYVLVIDRGEARAEDLPVTTPVPTMLAAGWGGSGVHLSIGASIDLLSIEGTTVELSAPSRYLRAQQPQEVPTLAKFVETVRDRFGGLLSTAALPLTLNGVRDLGLPEPLVLQLAAKIVDNNTEAAVMHAFWAAVAVYLGVENLERGLARKLTAAAKSADAQLVQAIVAALRGFKTGNEDLGAQLREMLRQD